MAKNNARDWRTSISALLKLLIESHMEPTERPDSSAFFIV